MTADTQHSLGKSIRDWLWWAAPYSLTSAMTLPMGMDIFFNPQVLGSLIGVIGLLGKGWFEFRAQIRREADHAETVADLQQQLDDLRAELRGKGTEAHVKTV